MEHFFIIFSHLSVMIGFLGKIGLIAFIAWSAPTVAERALRFTALNCGLLVLLCLRIFDFSPAEFIVSAVTSDKAWQVAVSIFGSSLFATIMAWWFVTTLRKNQNIAIRLLVLLGIITTLVYLEVYTGTIALAKGFVLDKTLLPNISFNITASLYAILNHKVRS